MPDVLGWRKKFGVLLPSSNSVFYYPVPIQLWSQIFTRWQCPV